MKKKSSAILTALLISFCSPIFTAAFAITPTDSIAGKKLLSLQDIWYSGKFSANYPNSFRGLQDGKSYILASSQDSITTVASYDIASGNKIKNLFSNKNIIVKKARLDLNNFELNQAENKVIIKYNIQQIYRHSSTCNALVYDINTEKTYQLPSEIMYPSFSPDGKYVAFVQKNNLFLQEITNGKTCQITKNGAKDKIINGAVDWVYEEEFGMDVGFFWSPNGKFISYYSMDETNVPAYSMDVYGSLYPTKEIWKYPKAGEKNAVVDIFIFDVKKKKSKKCNTQSQNDQYLPRMAWDNTGNYLTIQQLNRHQNELKVLKINTANGQTSVMYEEKNPFYIDIHDWHCTPQGQWLHLSEKSEFQHLWLFDPQNGTDKQITTGNFDIDNYYGFDNNLGIAYFNAGKDKATERQIYSVDIKSAQLTQLSFGDGWHNATFISGMQYYLDYFSSAINPGNHTLYSAKGALIKEIANNEKLIKTLVEYKLGEQHFGTFKNKNATNIDYWMLKPKNFDSSKKYPVLFYVYGGPGYQTAKNAYGGANYLWHEYIAQQGYIIITINNTGSGAQGQAFKKKTYLQLGNYETQDYIDAAVHFSNFAYVDKTRLGVWGWSYGGYMSSNCISRGAEYFKTAVAVAPVTNWRYYDNIYTERYMRTPQENALGYDTNSPINHIKKIKGNYLIIHGTADDNVHFQNAAEMILAMNNANIKYETAIYPNRNHGISGGKTRLHLFTKITNFITENL